MRGAFDPGKAGAWILGRARYLHADSIFRQNQENWHDGMMAREAMKQWLSFSPTEKKPWIELALKEQERPK